MTVRQMNPHSCPFTILVAEHYREDGTCRCDDLTHRTFMCNEWGYEPKDFVNVPIRVEASA